MTTMTTTKTTMVVVAVEQSNVHVMISYSRYYVTPMVPNDIFTIVEWKLNICYNKRVSFDYYNNNNNNNNGMKKTEKILKEVQMMMVVVVPVVLLLPLLLVIVWSGLMLWQR